MGVGFLLTLGIVGITYAAISQVNSGEPLTASKFNSLIDASYHNAVSKKITTDYTSSSASYSNDVNSNVNIAVKNNDLILVILDGEMMASNTSAYPIAKISINSGPGVFFSDSSPSIYAQSTISRYPFSITALVRVTADGMINLGYLGYCGNPGTCTFRNAELKAFTVGKYQ